MYSLGIAYPLGYPDLQRYAIIDGRSVLDKPFQNEDQRVLYKLVLVTDPFDHSERIYSTLNLFKNQQNQICGSP